MGSCHFEGWTFEAFGPKRLSFNLFTDDGLFVFILEIVPVMALRQPFGASDE